MRFIGTGLLIIGLCHTPVSQSMVVFGLVLIVLSLD